MYEERNKVHWLESSLNDYQDVDPEETSDWQTKKKMELNSGWFEQPNSCTRMVTVCKFLLQEVAPLCKWQVFR